MQAHLQSHVFGGSGIRRQKLKLKIKIKNSTFHFSDLSFFFTSSSKLRLLAKANFNPNFLKHMGLYLEGFDDFKYPKIVSSVFENIRTINNESFFFFLRPCSN